LRDQRYKLIHYSKDELSIRLSNVTVHDEGVYKCFYYGTPFKVKTTTVEVLAAPSKPVLEASQDTERGITLSCSTRGSKPRPQITWLLDNGIQLPGDTTHKLEANGEKWTTTSTLTVLAYGPNSTASCLVHHKALKEEKLAVPFRFEDLPGTAHLSTSAGSEATSAAAGEEELSGTPTHRVPNGTLQHQTWGGESQDSIQREKDVLLPSLVAVLIFVLLIIVVLFMRKLKKAHGVWKRENDNSEQTLESYKSKSNEESPGHEKNEQ
ncbi:CRTAM protein, partial [Asarcornis scutulata]|nr:CRTAM protein [Asarcornis scutulata]